MRRSCSQHVQFKSKELNHGGKDMYVFIDGAKHGKVAGSDVLRSYWLEQQE